MADRLEAETDFTSGEFSPYVVRVRHRLRKCAAVLTDTRKIKLYLALLITQVEQHALYPLEGEEYEYATGATHYLSPHEVASGAEHSDSK